MIGLSFGAHSTRTTFCINACSRFIIQLTNLQDITLNILQDSLRIVQCHLYGLLKKIYTHKWIAVHTFLFELIYRIKICNQRKLSYD